MSASITTVDGETNPTAEYDRFTSGKRPAHRRCSRSGEFFPRLL